MEFNAKYNEEDFARATTGGIRVISITSGKGGVGKSSIVLNLAIALAKRKKKVLILDADIGLANIDIMLGARPEKDIYHVLKGKARLKDVAIVGPYGLKLIPGGSGFAEFSNLTMAQKLSFLDEVEAIEDELDYVLIDTSAGIHSNVTFFNSCSSEIIVVANSEPTSITDAYALIKVLHKDYKVTHFSLIVNQVATNKEANVVYRKLSQVTERFLNISLRPLGYLPLDKNVPLSIREQNPILNKTLMTPYVSRLQELCDNIEKNQNESNRCGALQFFFRRMLMQDNSACTVGNLTIL